MDDIYRRENGYEKELQLLEKAQISQINKEIILKYHRHILSEGSGKNRVVKLSGELRKIAQWLNKPFLEVTEEDIRDLITQISQSDYAELTKVDFKKLVRRFYKWLEGNNKSYPDKVDWIKCKEKIGNKESLDIITPSEIKKVIDTCESPRDKAFISLLYEGGFRIGGKEQNLILSPSQKEMKQLSKMLKESGGNARILKAGHFDIRYIKDKEIKRLIEIASKKELMEGIQRVRLVQNMNRLNF